MSRLRILLALSVVAGVAALTVAPTAGADPATTVCLNGTQTASSDNVAFPLGVAPESFVLAAIAQGGTVYQVDGIFYTEGAYTAAGRPTPLTDTFKLAFGSCPAAGGPPGPSGIYMCSPENGPQPLVISQDAAKQAIANGWRYAYYIKGLSGGQQTHTNTGQLTCLLPAGATPVAGVVADDNGDLFPEILRGLGATIVYSVYTVG